MTKTKHRLIMTSIASHFWIVAILLSGAAVAHADSSTTEELVDRIYFSSGSAALSKDAKPALAALATLLLKDMTLKAVRIEGHADQRGKDGVNQLLSERRTRAVQNYLLAQGVPVTKTMVVSMGARRPLRAGENTVAHSRNRRVDLLLIRNQDSLTREVSTSERP